ncbi:Transcription initiation factor IIB protein [Marine Group I thaumarchaeote SCGC AAA799-E16]|uniref:Transcription initiation factor IIB n=4 Tax=Marine Group I TaxID=905826 RepID=A0A081RNL0_9ARCH|nr:Transcription initiation factor IIB protein [Marine Group I thaumarchaeote SCGC AAA799-N04]KER06283.1 Transcription initiation factor IIB protein [Marine Group I thaumarchaeote SCGC AAA799-E16]KFM15491.1 Transcription initiation factor IIB protein [Marine Group I thaumarchaeote SCGC AAA799-D11]KFM16733.1 Transcription initiation factor IIB protein [Marine Group I thaumarchaeote SCGC RSA3]
MSLQETKCPRCGKNTLVTDVESQEIFCSKYGMVINEKTNDTRPERSFSDSPVNKSHTGDKTSLMRHDRGLSTVINPLDRDSSGTPLSASMKSSLKRMRQWDNRSRVKSNDERNLQQALLELTKIKEKLSLPDAVAEKASYIYRKALEKKLIRGRSIVSLVAACLYAACRESETPRTLSEVATTIGIKRKEISATYRLIFRELDLKMPVVDSVSCIAKIASNAKVSEKAKRRAVKILKHAEKQNALAGKHPMGVAASALYIACISTQENQTQKDIADAAGITEVTIRNRCKSLREILKV